MLASPRFIDYDLLSRQIDDLERAARKRDTSLTLATIGHLVPEFTNGAVERRRKSGGTSD